VAPAGAEVGVQDAAVIVHQGTKSVGFAAPFAGVVEAVNPEALSDPGRVSRDPYAAGWLMVLRPQRLAEGMRRLRVGDDAARWMRAEVARLRDFLASEPAADPVGATMHDGGEPSVGVLEHLDTRGWERFESEFLAS
jgi:hypothetical protein